MNKALLKSVMALKGDTQAVLAKAMCIDPSTLSAKINRWEGREFSQTEIGFIKDRYNLTPKQVNEIFFAKELS